VASNGIPTGRASLNRPPALINRTKLWELPETILFSSFNSNINQTKCVIKQYLNPQDVYEYS